MDGTLTKIIGKNNPDSSRDKLTIGSDLVVRGNHDVKFYGETPGSYVLWDGSEDKLKIQTANDGEAIRLISSETGSATGPNIAMKRIDTDDSDDLGSLNFLGDNVSGSETVYAKITGECITEADNANTGRIYVSVANHNGSGTNAVNGGMVITGKDDSTIDVSLGYGAASQTIVVGDLIVSGGNITVTGAPSYTATTQTARNADTASTAGALQDVVQTLIDDLQDIGILG
jgi:hypothetical protein